MRLIDLKCPHCGADLQVNADLPQCVCNYCGTSFVVDEETKKSDVQIKNAYQFGYEQELGRQEALKKQQEEIAEIN